MLLPLLLALAPGLLAAALGTHPQALLTASDNATEAKAPSCLLDGVPPMSGFNPRGYYNGTTLPPAPPHRFSDDAQCEFAGQTRRIAFVHVGKTSGSTVHGLLSANGIRYTEYEVAMGTLLKKDLDQYDFFILVTRDPLARSVSSFNFDHLIGGGSDDVNSIVQDTLVPSLPLGCTDECDFCLPGSALVDPASSFNERPGYGTMPPYLVPNMTEAPLAATCTYDTFAGAVPTGPKPLMASMYLDCFPQLPGGVSAWAEALDGEGACADLARRHLHETAESLHMNNGFDHMVRESGLLDKLRAEATSFGVRGDAQTTRRATRASTPTVGLVVVRLENIDDDIEHMWQRLCITDVKEGIDSSVSAEFARHSDTTLSAAGEAALRAHLSREYHTLNSLLALASMPKVNATAPSGQVRFP